MREVEHEKCEAQALGEYSAELDKQQTFTKSWLHALMRAKL